MLQRKEHDREIIETVRAAPVKSKEIIVVNDCSHDGARELLERQPCEWVNQIIYHSVNQGKGAALRTGFQHATGDFVIVQDPVLCPIKCRIL